MNSSPVLYQINPSSTVRLLTSLAPVFCSDISWDQLWCFLNLRDVVCQQLSGFLGAMHWHLVEDWSNCKRRGLQAILPLPTSAAATSLSREVAELAKASSLFKADWLTGNARPAIKSANFFHLIFVRLPFYWLSIISSAAFAFLFSVYAADSQYFWWMYAFFCEAEPLRLKPLAR